MVTIGHSRRLRVALARAAVSAVSLGLALAAPAAARPITLAPPGNSAVSQYVEVVPTDRGPGLPRRRGSSGGSLPPGQQHRYAAMGKAGRTLVAVVEATSPGSASKPYTPGAAGAGRSSTTAVGGARSGAAGLGASGQGAAPLSTVLRAAASGGSGGVGVLLLVLMLGSAAGVFAGALWRRRARTS